MSPPPLRRSLARYYPHGGFDKWFLFQIPLIALHLKTCVAAECPQPTAGLTSGQEPQRVSVNFENFAPVDLHVYWVDFSGKEVDVGMIMAFSLRGESTYASHVFRFYHRDGADATLVFEHVARTGTSRNELGGTTVIIRSCGELEAEEQRQRTSGFIVHGGRADEFAKLVHDGPCLPENQSSLWSCVRFTPNHKYVNRGTELHGFKDKSEAQGRKIGETTDHGYTGHIPDMPRVTAGPGYLVMNFTETLKELLPWYAARVKDSVEDEGIIDGGYTNNHIVMTEHINLDNYKDMHLRIIKEMRWILQWWTQSVLKHTQTFGIRIYRRESMLINHVDRDDTHIASAVLQVHQDVDVDGGWPLEVISANGDCHEVYLQPGQMVLYEGGRFKHGRPMRLRGESFSNIFTHFAPLAWYGAKKSPHFEPYHSEL